MIDIAICDDEIQFCSELEKMLEKMATLFQKKIEINVFYAGEELYQYLSKGNDYDLIFLDIELKDMNGIDIGKKIRKELNNEHSKIVYISWQDEYAMSLFDVRPHHFLIKPINEAELHKVCKSAFKLIEKENEFFEYKIGHTVYKKKFKDIIYFESNNRKINIITTDGIMTFYGRLNEVYTKVEEYKFLYIHKSYIINYQHVSMFEYDRVTMSNSQVLPISQSKRKSIRKKQTDYRRGVI